MRPNVGKRNEILKIGLKPQTFLIFIMDGLKPHPNLIFYIVVIMSGTFFIN